MGAWTFGPNLPCRTSLLPGLLSVGAGSELRSEVLWSLEVLVEWPLCLQILHLSPLVLCRSL